MILQTKISNTKPFHYVPLVLSIYLEVTRPTTYSFSQWQAANAKEKKDKPTHPPYAEHNWWSTPYWTLGGPPTHHIIITKDGSPTHPILNTTDGPPTHPILYLIALIINWDTVTLWLVYEFFFSKTKLNVFIYLSAFIFYLFN